MESGSDTGVPSEADASHGWHPGGWSSEGVVKEWSERGAVVFMRVVA